MIDSFEDLNLISGDKNWDLKIQEHLGITVDYMQIVIVEWIKKNAAKLSQQFINIAPFGDFENLIYNFQDIEDFILKNTIDPKYWKMHSAEFHSNNGFIEFDFFCNTVDDGQTLKGIVYVSRAGKIRHAFATVLSI